MYLIPILLGVASTILAFFAKNKWKESNWATKAGLVVAVLAGLTLAYLAYEKVVKDDLIERVNADIGIIEDLTEVTIPLIAIGDGNIGMPISYFEQQLFYKWQDNKLLKVYVKNSKLYVSVVIHDHNQKPIAVINHNEWTVFDKNYEYNNDESGFELVTKGERKVYFQIYLKDGIAHILGIVTNSDGNGFKFDLKNTEATDKDHAKDELLLLVMGKESSIESYRPIDKAIFKYPRKTHLGERLK